MRALDRFRTERFAVLYRWVLVLVVTGVEVAVLGVWLALFDGADPLSRSVGVGVVVLLVGLQVSQFLTDLAVNGTAVGFPLGGTLAVSVSETVLWVGWFAVVTALGGLRGAFVGGVAFAVALAVQHTVETNALRGAPLTERLFDPQTVGYSLLTATAAGVWFALNTRVEGAEPAVDLVSSVGLAPATVGGVVLATGLLVEHAMGVVVARRERDEARTPARRGYRSGTRAR
ncbi:hypothetical protein [Halosimplex salinum]|uniref:hypothetical protein n=1 Tax=Halosimplex salinum TaxID=1710538 RepID=UPI000F4A2E56|nr:hypothetical protein [Halosimplex salinum]